MKWEFKGWPFIDISDSFEVKLSMYFRCHCATHAAHVDHPIRVISEPRAALRQSSEKWKLEHDFSRWITVQCFQGYVWFIACTASRTHGQTENAWTYLSHPPNTSFLTTLLFFCLRQKSSGWKKYQSQCLMLITYINSHLHETRVMHNAMRCTYKYQKCLLWWKIVGPDENSLK